MMSGIVPKAVLRDLVILCISTAICPVYPTFVLNPMCWFITVYLCSPFALRLLVYARSDNLVVIGTILAFPPTLILWLLCFIVTIPCPVFCAMTLNVLCFFLRQHTFIWEVWKEYISVHSQTSREQINLELQKMKSAFCWLHQNYIRYPLMYTSWDALELGSGKVLHIALQVANLPDLFAPSSQLLLNPIDYFKVFRNEFLTLDLDTTIPLLRRLINRCDNRLRSVSRIQLRSMFEMCVLTANSEKAIEWIEISAQTMQLPFFEFNERWDSMLEWCLDAAVQCRCKSITDRTQEYIGEFIKALLKHFGRNAVKSPNRLVFQAIRYTSNNCVAKELILHTNGRPAFRLSDYYRIRRSCLSAADIEEMYYEQIDPRYLLRLPINDSDPRLPDGAAVLKKLDQWKRRLKNLLLLPMPNTATGIYAPLPTVLTQLTLTYV